MEGSGGCLICEGEERRGGGGERIEIAPYLEIYVPLSLPSPPPKKVTLEREGDNLGNAFLYLTYFRECGGIFGRKRFTFPERSREENGTEWK